MWVPPNVAKETVQPKLQELKEESSKLTDTNVTSENCRAILVIGLTDKDFKNLQAVAESYPRVKNYGVLVRRVLRDAAKS